MASDAEERPGDDDLEIGDIIQTHPMKTRWGGRLGVVLRITDTGVEVELESGLECARYRTFLLWGAFAKTGGRLCWRRDPVTWIGEVGLTDWKDGQEGVNQGST